MNAQRWQRFSPFSRVAHSHTHTLSHFIYDAVSWAVLLHSQNTTHNAHTALLACLQTFSTENTTSVAFELNGCLNWFRRHQRFGTQFNSDLSIHHIIRACMHVCAIFFLRYLFQKIPKEKHFRASHIRVSVSEWCYFVWENNIYSIDSFIHFIMQCESFFCPFFDWNCFLLSLALVSFRFLFYLCFPLCTDKTNYYLKVQPFVNDMCSKQKRTGKNNCCGFAQKYKYQISKTNINSLLSKMFQLELNQWANRIQHLPEFVRF